MYYVSFKKISSARTGNVLFQYLFCKLLTIRFGHQYVALEDDTPEKNYANNKDVVIIEDANAEEYLAKTQICSHILLSGFFQRSQYYYDYRNTLLDMIQNSQDSWIYIENKFDVLTQQWNLINRRVFIREFFTCTHNFQFTYTDIVVSLRLDDFYQAPCKTSDIIPMSHYLNAIESIRVPESRVFILCDKLRYKWEANYVSHFSKYNPILIQADLMHDCAVMRDCPVLLHSNSTLCWIMSFFSKSKLMRIIPNTRFYTSQTLEKIEENDFVLQVVTLTHAEVDAL